MTDYKQSDRVLAARLGARAMENAHASLRGAEATNQTGAALGCFSGETIVRSGWFAGPSAMTNGKRQRQKRVKNKKGSGTPTNAVWF
jgi:hypothetical protein